MAVSELIAGDWVFLDHAFDSSSRLLIQVEVRGSMWLNIVVDAPLEDDNNGREWKTQLYDHFSKQELSSLSVCRTIIQDALKWCDHCYKTQPPTPGNGLFLRDEEGHPTIVEEMGPELLASLPLVGELFGKHCLSPIIARSDVRPVYVSGPLFFPQTTAVAYNGDIAVAKCTLAANRSLDDLREAVNLCLLPAQRPYLMPSPLALIQVSDTDKRICGFLVPLYRKGRLDAHARKLRESGGLSPEMIRSWFEQLVTAVKFLFDNDSWHGDIKPDNILVDDSDNLVLIDVTKKHSTHAIASPELVQGKSFVEAEIWRKHLQTAAVGEYKGLIVPKEWSVSAIEKADIYSIGRTMFFISEGVSMKEVYTRGNHRGPATGFQSGSIMPTHLRRLVLDCVNHSPDHRPTISQLLAQLKVMD